MKTKTRYVIYFTGLFESGYVRTTNKIQKQKDFKLKSMSEALDFAQKFRFKFMAKFVCWLCGKSDHNILRTFQVEEFKYNAITGKPLPGYPVKLMKG